jgi:hypothetical protein
MARGYVSQDIVTRSAAYRCSRQVDTLTIILATSEKPKFGGLLSDRLSPKLRSNMGGRH